MSKQFTIPEMPIFWREVTEIKPVEAFHQNGITLEGPQDWGGVRLATPDLTLTLQRIYREDENIGYLQDDNPLAELYAPEYISFIKKYAKKGGHISEIGAGGCYSLNKLKSLGFRVSAVDPSPITKVIGENLGIDVMEFFPLKNNAFLEDVTLAFTMMCWNTLIHQSSSCAQFGPGFLKVEKQSSLCLILLLTLLKLMFLCAFIST